ncbi:MAG: hypothetical protein WB781_10510, partial [Candidatus Sulfotelmatobacter sp.]
HQAVGISSRQGLKQDGTDQVENRRISANTQGEREDGHCGKARGLSQPAISVPEILKEAGHISFAGIAILGNCL